MGMLDLNKTQSHDGRDKLAVERNLNKTKHSNKQKETVVRAHDAAFQEKLAAKRSDKTGGRPVWLKENNEQPIDVFLHGRWQRAAFLKYPKHHGRSMLVRLAGEEGAPHSEGLLAAGRGVEIRERSNSKQWTAAVVVAATEGLLEVEYKSKKGALVRKSLPQEQVRAPFFGVGGSGSRTLQLIFDEDVVRRVEESSEEEQQQRRRRKRVSSPPRSPRSRALRSPSQQSPPGAKTRTGPGPNSPVLMEIDEVAKESAAAHDESKQRGGFIAGVKKFALAGLDAGLRVFGLQRMSERKRQTGDTPQRTQEALAKRTALGPLDRNRERKAREREILLESVTENLLEKLGGEGPNADVKRKMDLVSAEMSLENRQKGHAQLAGENKRRDALEKRRSDYFAEQNKLERSGSRNLL